MNLISRSSLGKMIEAHGFSSSDEESAIKNYVYIKRLKYYQQHLALQNWY